MSLAYYPCFEKLLEGIDPAIAIDGKMLAKASDKLTVIAQQLKVTPLEGFLGVLLDIELDIDIEELWFEPSEGLISVDALLAYLEKTPKAVPHQEDVISDLQGLKEALELAQQHKTKTRFSLAIDF